jgi:hypothetical protein
MVSAGHSRLTGLSTFKAFNRYAPFKSFKTYLARRGWSAAISAQQFGFRLERQNRSSQAEASGQLDGRVAPLLMSIGKNGSTGTRR